MALHRVFAALATLLAVASLVTVGGVLPSFAPATPPPGAPATDQPTPQRPAESRASGEPVEGGSGDGNAVRTARTTAAEADGPPLSRVVVVALGCLLLGGLALALGLRTDDEAPPPTDAVATRTEPTVERESPDPTDGVSRAWYQLISRLDEDPQSRTPAEFAERAVDAGMDPTGVRELTDLFCAVRYGGREPTPEDEQRAVDHLQAATAGWDRAATDAEDDPENRLPAGREGERG